MRSLKDYPGLPGLFVSTIFSGALSTLSSGFNSLAAIALQDVVRGYIARDLTERRATLIAKGLGNLSVIANVMTMNLLLWNRFVFPAVAFGVLCIALSFLASFMGGLLQVSPPDGAVNRFST